MKEWYKQYIRNRTNEVNTNSQRQHISNQNEHKRRFPEITGEDNLTVFSYSVRVTSPEWRRQRRRADLRHFEIFSHGPIIIYTRYQLGEPNYPICTFPASSECLIGISDAFSAFCLRVSVILPTFSLYPQQKRAYSALHPQAWTFIQVHTRRHLPSAVPWISEDRQLTPPCFDSGNVHVN